MTKPGYQKERLLNSISKLSLGSQYTFAPAQKSYRIGLLFTNKNGDLARFLERSEAAPRRSRKWSVSYRIGSVPHFGEV